MVAYINNTLQLFTLPVGSQISKRNLFDLIQYSKVEGSKFWSGAELVIGNTPQQGINWIGNHPYLKAVIIKTYYGAYKEDGWENLEQTLFRYSFKARNGKINFSEFANDTLLKQPIYRYPILLFIENGKFWEFRGEFHVNAIMESYVSLEKIEDYLSQEEVAEDEVIFQEGNKRYAVHIIVERSKDAVKAVKASKKWVCDICEQNYFDRYGVEYIEAHHKIPLSSFTQETETQLSDFVLLCPNCHKAVHIYMKTTDQNYDAIKYKLQHAGGGM